MLANRVGLVLVYCCSTLGLSATQSAFGQDGAGVKIVLKLTPSAPEKSTTPADSAQKPEQESVEAEQQPDEIMIKTSESKATESPKLHGPFMLCSFRLPSDTDTKSDEKGAKIQPPAELSLEQPPSPIRDSKRVGKPAAPAQNAKKPDSGLKLEAAPDKPKETKPLKVKPPQDASDNENAVEGDAECPGGVEGSKAPPGLPDDIPLEQDDHPYDAPAAESSVAKPDRPIIVAPLQLSGEQLRLRTEINELLRYYIQHPETIARRSPWAVMHAILPFGVEAELSAGNRRVNAIGWMSYNGQCKTQRIFQPTKIGFRTNIGPGVQGHEGQFLAILAQSKVAPTYPIKVGNRNYTIYDLVQLEMATCRENSELTFKLLGLSYYLDQNQRWRDNQGGSWTLEKLVAEELEQPIVGAACGGTHRLMGLSFSLQQRKQAGLPIDGHWSRSEQFLNEFVAYALSLQNPDGSFSTEWFEARANAPEIERKVQTTGHVLEWLVYTLPDDQLQSPPIQKGIRFLLNTIGAEPSRDWPIGPRGHSLRALALYNQRVFGAQPGKLKQYIANLNSETRQR